MKKICAVIIAMLMTVNAFSATITRYVNTGSTAGGNGTTNATTGDNRAYATLQEWEGAEDADLTDNGGDVMEVHCSGATDDTATVVTMDGWTTSASCYIDIYGDVENGEWDDNKYTLLVNNSSYGGLGIDNKVFYLRLHNMQFSCERTTGGASAFHFYNYNSTAGNVLIENCIFRNTQSSYGSGSAIYFVSNTTDRVIAVRNNISYGFNYNNEYSAMLLFYGALTLTASNNTSVGDRSGIRREGATTAITLYNNLCQDNVRGCYGNLPSPITSSSNIADDTSSPDDDFDSLEVTFVDAANFDFHLDPDDTNAIDAGLNLYTTFTMDIDGDTRPSTGAWCIGADQIASAAPPVSTAEVFIPYYRRFSR